MIMEDLLLYSHEAEQFLLGSLLLEPELIKDIKTKPEYLSPGKHYNILWTMLDLDKKGSPIDIVTIINRVGGDKVDKIGGVSYLSELASSVPTTANISFHENIIFQSWQKRKAVSIANKIKEGALSEEAVEVIRTGINDLMHLEESTQDEDNGSIKEDLVDVYHDLETPRGEITGIPTGFTELDRITTGLQRQDLIIVAARPSVGKTAFCLNIASGVALSEKYAVGIFSLEMGRKQLLKRLLSIKGNIDAQKIRTSNIIGDDWGKVTHAMGSLSDMNIRIFDRPGIMVNEIWSKTRKLKREFKDKEILIIIDYLQLIEGSPKHRGNRTQEIGEISRMLKNMARELDVCVIALSQLSRAVESRQDKRPNMSDIRESGQIEQDADVIGFLYRDDYYNKETENKNLIEVIIAKQRNGPVGTVQLAFLKEYGSFVNLERRFQ